MNLDKLRNRLNIRHRPGPKFPDWHAGGLGYVVSIVINRTEYARDGRTKLKKPQWECSVQVLYSRQDGYQYETFEDAVQWGLVKLASLLDEAGLSLV